MAYDRFLIAPYNSGLDKSLTSWLTPEDSFQKLKNASIFKGRIVKRFGSELVGSDLNSRVRYSIPITTQTLGLTDASGNITGNVAGGVYEIGQTFLIGTEIFEVVVLGTPGVMTTTGASTVHTFNTSTGAYVINGAAANTEATFYPVDNGETSPLGSASGTAPGNIFKVGQNFSIGDEVFTVKETGTPGTMLTTGSSTTHTFNTTNGEYDFVGASPLTQIYFYPSESIMGITHYEKGPINEHITYVFDTQFIYKYNGNSFNNDSLFTGTFHGSNKQFFWSTNYLGSTSDGIALFVSNFNATVGSPGATDDPMYYYDGSSWGDFSAKTKYNSASDIVASAKIIIAWKNRLLLLNTVEKTLLPAPSNAAHPNRIRYSHNGNPFSANAWLQRRQAIGTDKADGGGYTDAPVEEQIMSAKIINDRLVVYLERSTWELAYTGNTALPFIWKSISTDIGCESTFSTVNLENEIVTVDTTGVYACNGASIGRIDNKIPEEVFSFLKSSDGTKRVHGIKDFFNNYIYWTFLDNASKDTHEYPDKILVYNFYNQSWSIYDDTITTFGYFEQSSDKTWSNPGSWSTGGTWGGFYKQSQSRRILAGNHKGYLFLVNNDLPKNAAVLPIANLTTSYGEATLTIPDHNLANNEFVKLVDDNVSGEEAIFKIIRSSSDTIKLIDPIFTGTYKGNGQLIRVSKIDFQSKDWNPYIKTGDKIYLAKMDFCVVNTGKGELTVNYNIDSIDGIDFINSGNITGASLGTNIIELYGNNVLNPLDVYKKLLWKTIYFQALGDYVNINITLTDEQMIDEESAFSKFELQGMILYTMKEAR